MEPYILEKPEQYYLYKVRKLCNKYKALLIFDEVITGFRTTGYSAQAMFDVEADLTCLGKAMANGFAISCVCGKKNIMQELKKNTFVSSTFGGDLVGIAAALETIKIINEENVIEKIWSIGDRFINAFQQTVRSCNLVDYVKIKGYPCRTCFDFKEIAHKTLFWQECLKFGVLFGHAQFINYSHDYDELDITTRAMRHALQMVFKYLEHPQDALKGDIIQETFRKRE